MASSFTFALLSRNSLAIADICYVNQIALSNQRME